MAGTHTDRLTRQNAALLIIDHQIGLYTGVRDITVAELKHNVVAMTRAAALLGIPVIVTTAGADGMFGPTIPELVAELPASVVEIDRSEVNAWDSSRVVDAVKKSGRSKLIMAGVSTEVCLAFPAISAVAEGYDVYGVVDASGTFSSTKRETGLLRMHQAGVIPVDYASVMVEILADNADPLAHDVYGALDMGFVGLLGQYASINAGA